MKPTVLLALLASVCVSALSCAQVPIAESTSATMAPVIIGGNLEGIADWSYSNIFADLMKQSRKFGTPKTPWEGKIAVDAKGWPTEDFGVVLGSWNGMLGLEGTYKISCQCATTPTIALAASPGKIENLRRDTSTGLVTADLVYPAGGTQLMLTFTNTQGGVRNLKVMRPGYRPEDVFTAPFLKHCERFSAFRFMDLQSTNGNPVKHWGDRTLPSIPTYAAGGQVPWEVCISLCNQLKKDAWVNVPHQADDAYVKSLAQLLRESLDPSLHVYLEYSNEVWNWGFPQATWNKNQAAADVAAGDPDLNFDGIKDPNVWTARRIGKRIKTISDIFKSVYGPVQWKARIRPVLATQYAWPSFWLQDALTFLNDRFGPPDQYLYACAGAPYFNLGDADKRLNLSKKDVLDALDSAVTAFDSDLNADTCATLARYYNLQFVGYEAGPDTFGPNNIAAKKEASLDPQMKAITARYIRSWFSYGFGIMNWFTAGASSYDGQYGTWGLTNDMTNQSTPKIEAIDQVLSEKFVPVTKGILVPGEIDARQFCMRDAKWSSSQPPVLSKGDWRGPYRDYLVRSRAGQTYKVVLSAATDHEGNQVELWVNNQNQGSATLPLTNGMGIYKPVSAGSVTLQPGLNVIRIKFVSGPHAAIEKLTLQ